MSSIETNVMWTRRIYYTPCLEPDTGLQPMVDEFGSAVAGTEPGEAVRSLRVASRLVLNSLSIFVLSWVFGLAVLATAPYLMGFETVVIGSRSMEPSLRVADAVILTDPSERQVGPGSVINYWVDDSTRIHRVIEVTPDGYRTKGDANRTPDSGTVAPEAITGIGIYVVPFIGWPHHWFSIGHWPKLVALAAVLVLLASTERPGFVDRPQRRTDSRLGPVMVHRRHEAVAS